MGWKDAVLKSADKAIRLSGLPAAVMWANRNKATIAFYHDPEPELFEQHLHYLSERFNFVTLDALVDAVRARDWSGIPSNALAITLDDGHRGNHRLVPLFRRYEVRPLIYLCSQIVCTHNGYWPNEVSDNEWLKAVSNTDRLAELARRTGYEPNSPRPGPRQALSKEEILEMAPWVDFGSHTRSHPILTQCSLAVAREEIAESRRDLEQLLGQPCRHFCAPNGDWGEREIDLIKQAGYDSARTTDVGWVGPDSDVHRLKVTAISDDASIDRLAAQLSGLPRFAKNLARGALGGAWRQQPIAPR